MVDFSEFGRRSKSEMSIDPLEIFLKLPKKDVNDLYQSQSTVLSEWFQKRDTKDTIIKLHTGGGKTLVGLLIAKSIMNETKGPVLYLVPNKQLRNQVHGLSEQYGVDSEIYEDGYDFTDAYYKGERVLIATYAALFNGLSKFGVLGGTTDLQRLNGVIVDDSQIAPSLIRDQFTLEIPKESASFNEIRHVFKNDFNQIGKIGVFEDMEIGRDNSILEVPYWAIKNKTQELRKILQKLTDIKDYKFHWRLVRDNLDNCHILITSTSVVITPIVLDMDLFPSFANCPRRIFMSATIRDHGEMIRTFDLKNAHLNILKAKSVAGIGEKMIIAPELALGEDSLESVKKISNSLGVRSGAISVIVPSQKKANLRWADFGNIVTGEKVDTEIEKMLNMKTGKPTIFVNRYDGMDLKGDSCRILILDGLPEAIGIYDRYRATVTSGGESKATIIASRIEQGIGRSSRGSGDYSVVFLVDPRLTNWVNLTKNSDLLTVSTRSQINMGNEITKTLTDNDKITRFAKQCLERDKEWVKFHNDELVYAIENEENYNDKVSEQFAFIEREFCNLMKQSEYSKAYASLKSDPEDSDKITEWMLGWYKQMAARAAFYAGEINDSKKLQEQAYNLNKNLLRPAVLSTYIPLLSPVSQIKSLKTLSEELNDIRGLKGLYTSCVTEINMTTQTPRQFEESLKQLGKYLGFIASRPENDQGEGPDVLWLTPGNQAFIIEAKSGKQATSALNKEENGQMLSSIEWFKLHYPNFKYVPMVIMPTNSITHNATPHHNQRIMSATNLNSLISAGTELITKISYRSVGLEDEGGCSELITQLHLDFQGIIDKFTEAPIVVTT